MKQDMIARKNLELYVHIPFCVRKCNYCDFLSRPASQEIQEKYVHALINEINETGEEADYSVSSIFIGGGTPSVISEEMIRKVMEAINKKFQLQKDAEITIETNPGTLNKEKLQTYRHCGINRLSMGLQSPDQGELQILGRIHSYEEFRQNYSLARECGFQNINVDLMFALPEQTVAKWEKNLIEVAQLNPEHISAYSLIIEEGTPFAKQKLRLPSEEEEYQMYDLTGQILQGYGYQQYEISNYAKPGFFCRHNDGYWTRVEYLGFGLGAASLLQRKRYSNTANMEYYLQNSGKPIEIRNDIQLLTKENEIEEFMFLGLRRRQGISKKKFAGLFGHSVEHYYKDIINKYKNYELLEENDEFIYLSQKGIHLSNVVMSEFLF